MGKIALLPGVGGGSSRERGKLVSVKLKKDFKTLFQPIINSALTCVGRNSTEVTKTPE